MTMWIRYLARVPRMCMWSVLLLCGLHVFSTAHAQSPGTPGAAVPANDPFARYTDPELCVEALRRLEFEFWREKRLDTAPSGPLGRPAQRSTVEQMRRCVARFRVDGIADRDLLSLGRAYIAAELDLQADSAFQRLIARGSREPVEVRAWALAHIVAAWVTIAPVRLAKAQGYMRQLDGLGAPAGVQRTIAHLSIFRAARDADTVPLAESEAESAIRASRDIRVDSVAKQRAWDAVAAHGARAYVQQRGGDGAAAVVTLEAAMKELGSYRERIEGSLASRARRYRLVGQPAPQVRAMRWFSADSSIVDSLAVRRWPATGTNGISILAFSDGCQRGDCYEGYAITRRLRGQFDRSAVNVMFALRTYGYWGKSLETPASESEKLRKYFLGDLKLPVTLALWQTRFDRSSNDELEVSENPNVESYNPDFDESYLPSYVIDSRGIVRFLTFLRPAGEAALMNVVKSAR